MQRQGNLMRRSENKIKKRIRTPKQTIIIFGIGAVICIYLGFLSGACMVPGAKLSDFLNNFNDFIIVKHNFIVGVNEYTIRFIIAYLVAFSLAFILIATKIAHPFAGEEYGRAKWGDAKEFTRQFANNDEDSIVTVNTGDVVLSSELKVNTKNYWIAEGVYLSVENKRTSNLNMLVVGPPGSGKSFRLARPMLSNLCGNFLVTDPKGELYKQTGQYFEDNGYEVMVMNVESEDAMPQSIHFNPFSYIRNESDIMSIAGILMKATTPQEDNGSTDQFFEESAEVLLTSIIYLIHYYIKPEEQNWKTFVRLLESTCVYTASDGSIENKEGGILSIMEDANKYWHNLGHEDDFPGYKNVEKYYHGASETTSSIVATLDAHCRYMKLKCVIDLLSEDEINIKESFGYSKPCKEARTGKRILYIVTSEDKRYYDWIPSMVYSLFFDELYHLTSVDESLHETLPEHLTFLMDEFANVTLPDSFVEKLSTMRSRNMSAVIIIQNLIQLKRKFPKFDMDKDLIGNCSIIHILGAPDMDSCEYLSKHFGTQTIHKASDSDAKDHKGSSSRSEDVLQKSLLSAEDIFSMNKDGECAIVVKGTEPLFEQKCQMERTPFIKLLCRKTNPYDVMKRIKKRESLKEEEDEIVLIGDEAREFVKHHRENGGQVIRLKVEDLLLYKRAIESKQEVLSFPISDSKRRVLERNYESYINKKSGTFNYEIYREEGIDNEEFRRRCTVARILLNKGFSNRQVESMSLFIKSGKTVKDILKLFAPTDSVGDIENFIGLL